MSEYPNTQLLIAGKWCEGSEGRQLPVYNPATGSAIGAVALADLADLETIQPQHVDEALALRL